MGVRQFVLLTTVHHSGANADITVNAVVLDVLTTKDKKDVDVTIKHEKMTVKFFFPFECIYYLIQFECRRFPEMFVVFD